MSVGTFAKKCNQVPVNRADKVQPPVSACPRTGMGCLPITSCPTMSMVSLPGRGDLRVGQWNINGMRTQTHDKLADSAVCDWIQSMDIAAFTVKLNNRSLSNKNSIPKATKIHEITVAYAAPIIPISGNPHFPKINA